MSVASAESFLAILCLLHLGNCFAETKLTASASLPGNGDSSGNTVQYRMKTSVSSCAVDGHARAFRQALE